MAHPVVWLPKSFFYPIGNTPATSLTEYLPPDVDAKILVLGCGDPRSALYTIHSNSKLPFDRSLDFTFCDTEPGVLARNILIYTLLSESSDEETIKNVWKIYFDVFIDKQAFDAIASQCAKLVDLSGSLDSWNASPYGAFIKFCTLETMNSLRNFWELYLSKDRSPTKMKAEVAQDMKKMYSKKVGSGHVLTSMRSAGIMALELGMRSAEHFQHYWKHGVTDVNPLEVEAATHVNTTLLYSSSGSSFNIHYGTDPMMCFHLASALLPLRENPKTPAKDLGGIIAVMKSQFADWCHSFHARTKSSKGKLFLRFFAGNGITFCKALDHIRRSSNSQLETGEYTTMWGGSTITFVEDYKQSSQEPRPPTSFNAIETSNLSDHLGFLNILLTAAPLLERKAGSMLFTHSMLQSKDGKAQYASALEKIEVSLPLLSLILGIVPSGAISEYTSQSISHDLMSSTMGETVQCFEFNAWRVSVPDVPGFGHSFSCSAKDLGDMLFAVYLKMFADEGFGGFGSRVLKGGVAALKHYIRDTLVSLLYYTKAAYTGDWDSAIGYLLDAIAADRTLFIAMNSYQDLCRSLQEAGLFNVVPEPKAFKPASRGYYYQGWKDIPRIVTMVLVIPRTRIQELLDYTDNPQSPLLQCQVEGPPGHSMFSAIQGTFGTIEETSPAPNKSVVIHEDPAGWQGKSDMIVHFLVPAWNYVEYPRDRYKVGLYMHGMNAVLNWKAKLGLTMCIYGTTLADTEHAFIVRYRPRVASQSGSEAVAGSVGSPRLPGITSRSAVEVKVREAKPASFVMRAQVHDKAAKATLAIKTTAVKSEAVSPYAVHVSFARFESTIYFPYPVDTSTLTTRIARTSSYIEVEARIAKAPKTSIDLNPFPIITSETAVSQLGMHYLALEALPALRNPLPQNDKDTCGWSHRHFSVSLGTESQIAKAPGRPTSWYWELKDSLCNIFARFVDFSKGAPLVFQLSEPQDGVYMILFVSCMRIDLTAHTLVLDTCVMPITMDLIALRSVRDKLTALNTTVPSVKVTTAAGEVPWWKAYIPTAVERCRTWAHSKNCEYQTEGAPRSLEYKDDPLCSCGHGKDRGPFDEVPEWAPFKEYVVRAAIGVPFPTSLVGTLVPSLEKFKKSGGGEGCEACGGLGKPKLMFCAKCREVRYCSAACQKADWKRHKTMCGK
ncbi:hypothetical protein D9611_002806 [Ephemerocybe angulata]|uniref:MYND-type domain-containing protein n=1 Tax=Ephemerocybe angulata TaxID=980116 RepID=A0A8H5C130_9AGAR|nr:hypothetical protein D9611_002806 [Tulosesus angulatus]